MENSISNSPSYVEYTQAVYFLTKIKERFRKHPTDYMRFQKILNDFQIKQQAIYKHDDSEENILRIIRDTRQSIIELLRGRKDLVKEFLFFLPDGQGESGSDLDTIKRQMLQAEENDSINYKFRVIKEIKDTVPRHTYKLFLRALNLYSNGIVGYKELMQLVSDLARPGTSECFAQFMEAIDNKGESRTLISRIGETRRSERKRATPSYLRIAEEDAGAPAMTTRSSVCGNGRVLNNSLVSVPYNKEGNLFHTNNRNEYEERMLLFEDDRYELDVLIALNERIIAKLERFVESVGSNGHVVLAEEGEVDLSIVERNNIRKLYGSKGSIVVNLLDCKPSMAVPVILERCIQKRKEWNEIKRMLSYYWRRLSVNMWLHRTINKNTKKHVKFRSTIDKNYLLNELSNASCYNHCYSKEPVRFSATGGAAEGGLSSVLQKHENFLFNTNPPNPPSFLTPIEKLRKDPKNSHEINLGVPREIEIVHGIFLNLANAFFKQENDKTENSSPKNRVESADKIFQSENSIIQIPSKPKVTEENENFAKNDANENSKTLTETRKNKVDLNNLQTRKNEESQTIGNDKQKSSEQLKTNKIEQTETDNQKQKEILKFYTNFINSEKLDLAKQNPQKSFWDEVFGVYFGIGADYSENLESFAARRSISNGAQEETSAMRRLVLNSDWYYFLRLLHKLLVSLDKLRVGVYNSVGDDGMIRDILQMAKDGPKKIFEEQSQVKSKELFCQSLVLFFKTLKTAEILISDKTSLRLMSLCKSYVRCLVTLNRKKVYMNDKEDPEISTGLKSVRKLFMKRCADMNSKETLIYLESNINQHKMCFGYLKEPETPEKMFEQNSPKQKEERISIDQKQPEINTAPQMRQNLNVFSRMSINQSKETNPFLISTPVSPSENV